MSSDTQPINPARFAEALKELPSSSLALKVLELRNSMAHLDYSNAELKPFAEGRTPTIGTNGPETGIPDQDCVDAIAENEVVIARMQQRIELIKAEVEGRGLSWNEFKGTSEEEKADTVAASTTNGVNGQSEETSPAQHSAWTDGTFQTGVIRSGPGLSDEELLRQLQDRIPEMRDPPADGDDDGDGGMHL